jgi:hypothetical protein
MALASTIPGQESHCSRESDRWRSWGGDVQLTAGSIFDMPCSEIAQDSMGDPLGQLARQRTDDQRLVASGYDRDGMAGPSPASTKARRRGWRKLSLSTD